MRICVFCFDLVRVIFNFFDVAFCSFTRHTCCQGMALCLRLRLFVFVFVCASVSVPACALLGLLLKFVLFFFLFCVWMMRVCLCLAISLRQCCCPCDCLFVTMQVWFCPAVCRKSHQLRDLTECVRARSSKISGNGKSSCAGMRWKQNWCTCWGCAAYFESGRNVGWMVGRGRCTVSRCH